MLHQFVFFYNLNFNQISPLCCCKFDPSSEGFSRSLSSGAILLIFMFFNQSELEFGMLGVVFDPPRPLASRVITATGWSDAKLTKVELAEVRLAEVKLANT